MLVVLIGVVSLIVFFEGGLNDSRTGGHPGYWDCLYFTIVTVTTVGYGDIVPVATVSRLFDALVLTPVRFLVMFIVLGTAYQIAYIRFREEYRMMRAKQKLDGHIVLCGYGATGRAAFDELILQGTPPGQIAIVDIDKQALDEAGGTGAICVLGDAAREQILESVAIARAAHILVCPGRDDTAVLVALTARDLNPEIQVIAMCHESENVKLLKRGGAHHIVNPAFASGTIMASATRQAHLVDTLTDILSVGGGLQLDERAVREHEVGKVPADIRDTTILRIYRGGQAYGPQEAGPLRKDDVLVYAIANAKPASA